MGLVKKLINKNLVSSCSNCTNLKSGQFAFFPKVYGCKKWKRMKEHKTVIYGPNREPSTTECCRYYN